MPSPIRPASFCDAVPATNADLCTRFSKLLNLPQLLCDLFGWMLSSTGALSEEFKAEVAIYSAPTGFTAFSLTLNAGDGWLLADGSEVSRTTYAALFAEIGTRYGDGDASTTFNLPDMRGRSPIGAGAGTGLTNRSINDVSVGEESHTPTVAETAAHAHGFTVPVSINGENGSGASILWKQSDPTGTTDDAGGGQPFNVIHPCIIGYWFIKI